MVEMDFNFWQTIAVIKKFCDSGKADILLREFGNCNIDGDYLYELCIEGMHHVFSDTVNYYHEETMNDVYVFQDVALDRFYELCRQYEKVMGISPEDNLHRKEMRTHIEYALTFDDYSYDFHLYTDLMRKGRCRIVLILYEEFYNYFAVPGGLLDIQEALEYHIQQIEQGISDALNPPTLSILTPNKTVEQEAA